MHIIHIIMRRSAMTLGARRCVSDLTSLNVGTRRFLVEFIKKIAPTHDAKLFLNRLEKIWLHFIRRYVDRLANVHKSTRIGQRPFSGEPARLVLEFVSTNVEGGIRERPETSRTYNPRSTFENFRSKSHLRKSVH
jgi:hypothetical protein